VRPWGAVAVSLPAVAGVGLGLLFERGIMPDPWLFVEVRADLAGLIFRAGVALSLLGWGALGIYRWHVGRLRATQREARAGEELRWRRFLRALEHELKNPLGVILAAVANLETGVSGQAAGLGVIAEQARRLGRLASELRRLAELEEVEPEGEPVDVAVLLGEVVAEAGKVWGRVPALSVSALPWAPGPVVGDRDLLFLAFFNLVDNALKFGG
jgi:two-component system OmpR family sensor kinase